MIKINSMTTTQAELISNSVHQLRKSVESGFANAALERKEMSKEIKLLNNWKNKQDGKEEAIKDSIGSSNIWMSAFLVLLGAVATLAVAGFALISK